MRSLIHSPLNEIGLQSGVLGEAARGVERLPGEIEPSREGAESNQAESIQPDMALQMEHVFSADIAELGRFDPVERTVPRTKAVQFIEAGSVARVDRCALAPIAEVDVDRVGHAGVEIMDATERERFRRINFVAYKVGVLAVATTSTLTLRPI